MSKVSGMVDHNKRPLKEESESKAVGDLPDGRFFVRSISYEVQKKDGMIILIGLPKFSIDGHLAVIPFPISRLRIEGTEDHSRIIVPGK